MPQAELMTNEILILIGIPVGLLFSDLSGDGGVDVSEDEYLNLFIEFAYHTDKLCFLLDILIQRLFTIILGYTFLNGLNAKSEHIVLLQTSFKNEFTWLNSFFDSSFDHYYRQYLDDFWDDKISIVI